MKKNTTPAGQRPDAPPEEPGRDESGLTDGPQSEQGLKATGRKTGKPDTSPPKKGAPGTTGAVGDDDAAEGL